LPRILSDPEESKDLSQGVFLNILRYKAKLKEVKNMGLWITKITTNLCINRLRKAEGKGF
jgi:DNA-directed RNA polymerase specialized sigma24 family protein